MRQFMQERKMVICTLCPNGCEIEVTQNALQGRTIIGNQCEKGYTYAINECVDPRRTFTGSIRVIGNPRKRLPVRTTIPIPMNQLICVAEYLRSIYLETPIKSGTKILENVCDTGADIVATMSLGKEL